MAKSTTKSSSAKHAPAAWPGAFEIYKHSKAAVTTNLSAAIFIFVVSLALGGALSLDTDHAGKGMLGLLVDVFTFAAGAYVYTAGVHGKRVEISDAVKVGLNNFVKMLGLYILVGLSLVGSLLLLIVPFFFVLPRLLLANYFLVNENLGVVEAYKASWNATKGHSSKVWGIVGVMILMMLLMVTIIGIPFAIYLLFMYSAALAVLYEHIKRHPAA